MPTAPTPIEPVPTPVPSTDDPTNFDARADAMMEWFEDGIPGIDDAAQTTYDNALEVFETATTLQGQAAVAADAAGLLGSSTTTLTVGAGNKDFTLQVAKPNLMTADRRIVFILKSDPTIRMFASIDDTPAPTSTTGRGIVTTGDVSGSGSYSDWHVMDAAFLSAGATADEIRAALTDGAGITPKGVKDALATETLTFGGTVTIDAADGKNWALNANTSFTLGAVSNTYPGDVLSVTVTHTAGGNVLAVGSAWKRRGGLGILSTTNGHIDEIIGIVKTVDGSGNATRIVYDILRNPT